jgi:hypothetical protein
LRITAISSFEFCRKTAGAVAGVVGIEGGAVSGVIHLESSGLVRRTADYVMKSITWKSDSSQPAAETAVYLFDDRLVHSKLHVHLDASRHFPVCIRTGEEEACHGHLLAYLKLEKYLEELPHPHDQLRAATAPTAASTAKVISWTILMPSVRPA